MANAMNSRSNETGLSAIHTHRVPGQETLLLLCLTPPWCIYMGTSKLLGVTLQWTSIPSREECIVKILSHCTTETGDKN